MMKRTRSLGEKIDARLCNESIVREVDELFQRATSPTRFKNADDLSQHLSEGALLNVGKIASKALSVPCGDYMVWMTDAGHTMLVPVGSQSVSSDIYEHSTDTYDIFTKTLLQNWSKLERTLAEEEKKPKFDDDEDDEEEDDEIGHIEMNSVDRKTIARAIEDRGYTVTSLAAKCGVLPPAISRILRKPKDSKQGDPGGRNPSAGLAGKICKHLRLDPKAAFPDIFGSKPEYEARKPPKNRGSGMTGAAAGSKRKGAASEKWSSGND